MAVGRIVLSAYMPARDRNGRLVNGAKLYVYQNRTTTKATLFADSDLSVPLANPVQANSSGQFPDIWAERGSVEAPELYTLSVTGKDGSSIGNPSVFDDFMPSSDEMAELAAYVAVEAAQDASADAAAAGAAASTATAAAGDAETAATAAAADAAAADADRIAAETARNEAEAIVSATPTSASFATDADGRAAVSNGQQYWLRTTDGLRMKTRVDASTSADFTVSSQPVILMSINGMYMRLPVIRFEVTALGANNDYTVRPFDHSVRVAGVAGTGLIPYWEWEIPKANTAGSGGVTVTVLNGDGTTFITTSIRKDFAGTNLDPGDHQTGGLFTGRRMTAAENVGQPILWLQPLDTVTKRLAPLSLSLDDMGPVPSVSRPLEYYKADLNQHFVQMAFGEDHFLTGDPFPSDIIRVAEMDMATFQSDTGNCLSLNSTFSRVGGLTSHDLNMLFFDLVGGSTVDTGRVPTTIGESPVIGGKFGDAVGLYVVSGPGHGYVHEPATTLSLTLNDITTGNVDSVTSIPPTAVIGTRRYGDKLVKTLTAKCVNAAGDVYCVATWVVTYDPSAPQQIRIQATWDFTHASVTVTPGFLRGFGMAWAMSEMNRCQAVVNGVKQPIQSVDLRDNSDTTLGFPEKVIFWRDGRDERQIIVTNNFGYGYTHKENGVLVPVSGGQSQTYVDNFDWGIKLYAALFGDHTGTTPRNMTGIVVTLDYGVEFVNAPARSYP